MLVENGLLFIEVSLEGVIAGTTVATVDAGSHGFDMSETSGGRLPG